MTPWVSFREKRKESLRSHYLYFWLHFSKVFKSSLVQSYIFLSSAVNDNALGNL